MHDGASILQQQQSGDERTRLDEATRFGGVLQRPGLLAAHPGSWEGLLMRAEEERARSHGGLEASAAVETAQLALMGLASLKGQEMPMQLFGLPYCIMTDRRGAVPGALGSWMRGSSGPAPPTPGGCQPAVALAALRPAVLAAGA
ncbi:hypothetical protein PLESTF_001972400 [Pleodorina starrii]|nr:hypothetical protein PLESTF_001972400 [Pleodorina starrii]